MLFDFGGLALGCGLLFYGGDWLVNGVSGVARRLQVSPVLVAIVLVGFGTSAPELFVAVDAVVAEAPDIAMDNIVGSNIANLLLVLSLAALVAPIAIDAETLRIEGAVTLAASVALLAVAWDGIATRPEAGLLLAGLLAYLLLRWRSLTDADEAASGPGMGKAVLLSVLSLAALCVGADLFVNAAADIAAAIGVSEVVIGLTVVAIGTSLPEIAVSLIAAFRREPGMIVGGILGSNVFNGTVVLGGAALVRPVAVADPFVATWIPMMVAATVLALVLLRTGHLLTRMEGGVMLAVYVAIFAF